MTPGAATGAAGNEVERWGAQTRLAIANFPISGEPMR